MTKIKDSSKKRCGRVSTGSDDSPGSRKISRRDFLRIAALTGGAFALCSLPDALALSAKRITIAAGGIGSVDFALGARIAKILARYSGLEAVAEITAGPADNCELVGSKKSDLGFATADMACAAFQGTGPFRGIPVPIYMLTALCPDQNVVIIVCHKDMDTMSAYNMLGIIIDHIADIYPVHPEARHKNLEYRASFNSIIPYHPGAMKFFADRGIAVPAVE